MWLECSPDHMGSPGGPRAKNQDGGVRVSISKTLISVSSHFSDGRIILHPQALIKRRLENRAKRSSSSQINSLGLNKGSRYISSVKQMFVMLMFATGTAINLLVDTKLVMVVSFSKRTRRPWPHRKSWGVWLKSSSVFWPFMEFYLLHIKPLLLVWL